MAKNLPVVMTADFNSRARDQVDWGAVRQLPDEAQRWIEGDMPPANTVHKILIEQGFKDTFLEVGPCR